jgi:hypothetical protein
LIFRGLHPLLDFFFVHVDAGYDFGNGLSLLAEFILKHLKPLA